MWTFFMVIAVCIILLFDFINTMLEKRIAAKEAEERKVRLARMDAELERSRALRERMQQLIEASNRRTEERARLAVGIIESDD